MQTFNETDNMTYADIFNIVAENYCNDQIGDISFSTRVRNSLLRNRINTLEELLNITPEKLRALRGFGKGCFDEIEKYFATLTTDENCLKNEKNFFNHGSNAIARKYKQNIVFGDFSFIEKEDLTEDNLFIANNYKNAFAILGPELTFDCVCEPQKITPLINMLTEYQSATKRYSDIMQYAYQIPKFRLTNKATGYIRAFTTDESKRNLLNEILSKDDDSIFDLINNADLNNDIIYLTLKQFVKWCSFNLSDELDCIFNKLYTKPTYSVVINMRAQRKTLEEIGGHLGVTRERIRQIEAKIKRKFNYFNSRYRIISKIYADRNSDTVITPLEIAEQYPKNATDLIFLLQYSESPNYTYDKQFDVFIVGTDSIKETINNYIETLPEIIKVNSLKEILEIAEESGISSELLEKAILDNYRCTGDVYHRYRLSLASIYAKVLEFYYPDGFKAYDAEEIAKFRQAITDNYGDVGLPENDRALTARVSSICVLCGKGIYKLKNKAFMSKSLADKIYTYINQSDSSIFLTNSLFTIFENELRAEGIDNKYFLQGILRDLFGDKFFFKKDYIAKDFNVNSFHSEVVAFIKKSNFPVSKREIQKAFPGITEIVINFSVDDPNVLNYFGEYLHVSKLSISAEEKMHLYTSLMEILSDGGIHHSRDVYEIISKENSEILTRNAALYPFSTYSILEYLFRDDFQFMRPYIAKNGTEIIRTAERLHEFIYTKDKIFISAIAEFAKENHFQIQSILEYINSCNDEYLLINDNLLMRIESTGINEDIARRVDDIIAAEINETVIINNLNIWQKLPPITLPWTDWLIYSIITKWGRRTFAGTSSKLFKLSVPLVAPINNFDPSAFKDIDKGDVSAAFIADDLSNIDSLLENIMDDDFFDTL